MRLPRRTTQSTIAPTDQIESSWFRSSCRRSPKYTQVTITAANCQIWGIWTKTNWCNFSCRQNHVSVGITWKTWLHSLKTSSLWRNTRKEMNADILSLWIMDSLETYRVFIHSGGHAIDMEYNEIGLWWSPVPDKSGKTLMVFHSCFTLATWYNLHQPKPSWKNFLLVS